MRSARDLIKINVKRLREGMGWKQPDLAAESALSHQMIQKIEQGKTAPSTTTLDKLVSALNTNHAELFRDDTLPNSAVARTVAEMPAEELIAHLSNVSNKDTLELMRLKKKLESIPEEVLESWREASTANKALCMFLLTGDGAYVDVLPLSAQSTLKTILRALGTKLP